MSLLLNFLKTVLGLVLPNNKEDNDDDDSSTKNASPTTPPTARQFVPTKDLCEKDFVVIDMLNSAGHEHVSFCITDPAKTDNPIIFCSDGFSNFTGYASTEIEGRNCRFLQGKETSETDVTRIRTCIQQGLAVSVNLLNYRKDGTPFNNEFFLSPLYDNDKQLCYFIGVQCPVKHLGPGQAPSNPGYVHYCSIVDIVLLLRSR